MKLMTNEENDVVYLPFSGRRYRITRNGDVLDYDGNLIESETRDNEVKVNISWIDGDAWYSVGMLVIFCFNYIFLPDHKWTEIKPLHLDGNIKNNQHSNLIYTFRTYPLPYDDKEGFYYIPFFTQYAINQQGVLINTLNKRVKTWYQEKQDHTRNSKGGYFGTRVVGEQKQSRILLRHRGLALAFKGVGVETFDKIVNHDDGVPGNDWLSNLSWATYSSNNKHAHDNNLTGDRRRSVSIRKTDTGEINVFKSTKEAAKFLGFKSNLAVRFRLRHGVGFVFDDGYEIKWTDEEWPVLGKDSKVISRYPGMKMAARNVFTGEVFVFDTYREGESQTGIDHQTIMIHVRDERVVPYSGFNFTYYREPINWPVHSELNLAAYRSAKTYPKDPVLLTNRKTGETQLFNSSTNVAEYLGCSVSSVSNSLHRRVFSGHYEAKNISLLDGITVPSDWKV